MYSHDNSEQENYHYLSVAMEVLENGLKKESLVNESQASIQKMIVCSDNVVSFYSTHYSDEDREHDTKIANKLLEAIQRDCPEHLI